MTEHEKQIFSRLRYDQNTGYFTWAVSPCNRIKSGSVAGADHCRGYRQIRVDGNLYLAHRLAWFISHGKWPDAEVDHINGIRNDNRLCNLRAATTSENRQNQRAAHKRSKSGFLGVSADHGRWSAHIRFNGKNHYVGCFETPESAHAAYLEKKREFHPFGEVAK